jgi:hypothetical protein
MVDFPFHFTCSETTARLGAKSRVTKNDLDVDTPRALAEALDFAGCAVIISHDGWFLDRIATNILAFDGDSHVEWFEGNFPDYEADKMRRLGTDTIIPHRLKYKKFSR